MLQSLGVKAIAAIVNKTNQKNKPRACEDPDPLYEPRDDEHCEQEIFDKDIESNMNVTMSTRVSKRVRAGDQTARMTRQRTREPCPVEDGTIVAAQEYPDALIPSNCAAQLDDQIQKDIEVVFR